MTHTGYAVIFPITTAIKPRANDINYKIASRISKICSFFLIIGGGNLFIYLGV